MAETASLEWLNRAYLKDLLRKALQQNDLDVLELQSELATAAGENYASKLLRVRAIIKRDKNSDQEKMSLIAKILDDTSFSEIIKEYSIFHKEAEMFINVLPAIDKLLRKVYPKHEPLQAACYGFDRQHRDAIFFQDLRELGFRLSDRCAGELDQAHTDLALKSLAKYHAASVVHLKDHPEALQALRVYDWNVEMALEMIGPMYKNAAKGYLELVNTWPDGPEKEKYLEKINKLLDDEWMNQTMKLYTRDEEAFNVITHGDCWINNMMFKYEGSKPVAIKWVDFQVVDYNSPATDLVYFVFTSQPDELRFGNKDAFLRTYHETFTETLEKLNFVPDKPFTFEELKNQFQKKLMHGLYALLIVYPITICPPEEVAKTDDFLEGDGSLVGHIYNNETMEGVLRKAVPYFEEHNVI